MKHSTKRFAGTASVFCILLCMSFVNFERAPESETNNPGLGFIGSDNTVFTGYKVLERWAMPKELLEISSNVFIDDLRMACIQDNKGVIYTYNLKTHAIENEIQFEEKGDFESLVLVGKVYYVLRSDGMLYEISVADGRAQAVKKYDLPFGPENDTESMAYDKTKKRLLIAVKEKDLSSPDKKGIYSFDLVTKRMDSKPVFLLNTDNMPEAHNKDHKKKGSKAKNKNEIKPSEIVIHPKRGTLLILNGPSSELLEADFSGKILSRIKLSQTEFPQPEGMCFSGQGEFYISSEGAKDLSGVIARVQLEDS